MGISTQFNVSQKSLALVATLALTTIGATALVGKSAGATGKEQSVAARLQHLEDVESIRTLLEHYIELNESHDYAAYSQMFAKDGELVLRRGRATGPEAILAMMNRDFGGSNAANAPRGITHVLSNVKISVTGDTGTATSRWTMMVPTEDNRVRLGGTGRYGDKLVRENGEWKFQQRIVYRDIPADTPSTPAAKK